MQASMQRLMMATRSRNLPRKLIGDTRTELGNKDAAVTSPSPRASTLSAPNSSDQSRVRARSTQPPPRLLNRGSQGSRRTAASGSASNLNVNRNTLRTAGSSSYDRGLNRAFQKLTVTDQKTGKNVSGRRQVSTSAGSTSSRSSSCKSLEDVARRILLKKSKNIVVMAGAGISTPSGIPDFRSPGSGLYDNLQQYHIPYPEAIFDIDFFRQNPRPFFTLAKELYPSGRYRPNYVHYFVRMLHDRGILLRMYTQNIDGLERLAGIPKDKLVEAHGTFTASTCTRCGLEHDMADVKEMIFSDKVPKCKRPACLGVVKPNIVFFGEDLPKRFFFYMKDMPQCDLLIVMGTSLEVYPFAGILDSVRPFIPRLLINREAVGPFQHPAISRRSDLAVTGDLVECVQRFARVLGWKKAVDDLIRENEAALDEMIAADEAKRKGAPDGGSDSNHDTQSGSDHGGGATPGAGPKPPANLQRTQDASNVRKLHVVAGGLSRANSATRLSGAISDSSNQKSNISLPTISSANRNSGIVHRPSRTVVSSESSDTSSCSDSSDDDSDS